MSNARVSWSLVLSLVALPAALRAEISVVDRTNEFYIESSRCSEIRETMAALKDWTAITRSSPKCEVKSERNGMCRASITNCVPDHVLEYSGSKAKMNGPNCFNLALVMQGILPNLRYTTQEEMAFYMKPPLCRQLRSREPRRPGDIGAIRSVRSNGVSETHGFIYINEHLAYSKNGLSAQSPYALQTLQNVYNVYGISKNPNCSSNRVDPNSGCREAAAYFRCESLSNYIETHPEIPEQIHKSLADFSKFENCLQTTVINGAPVWYTNLYEIEQSAKALADYAKAESAKARAGARVDDSTKFLLGSLQLRLRAIGLQLGGGLHDSGARELELLALQMEASLKEL